MRSKKKPAIFALAMAVAACSTSDPKPDPGPTEAPEEAEATPQVDPATAPILDDATLASIDAFSKAHVNDSFFVPIYLGERGVAVDGQDAVRYAPGSLEFADDDRRGGPNSLYIESLVPSLEAASRARPMSPEDMQFNRAIAPIVHVEPAVPFRTFTDVLYTSGQALQPTYAEGDESRFVELGGGSGILKVSVRRGGSWHGFNATTPRLEVGPPDEEELDAAPLELTLLIEPAGVRVAGEGALLPPIAGCPAGGPTVCNEGGVDASDLMGEVRASSGAERDAALSELVALYDLSALYAVVLEIKKRYPDETVVTIAASQAMPFAVVSAVSEAVRWTRGGADGAFADDAAFEAAAPSARPFAYPADPLFADLVFAIAR